MSFDHIVKLWPVSWFEPGQDGSSKRSLVRFHPTGNEDEGDLVTKVKEKDTAWQIVI